VNTSAALRQFDVAVATLRPRPTLLSLARAAVAADAAERAHLTAEDNADATLPTDIDLWTAKIAARETFFAALEAETGIDRALFAKLEEL
jgi:hypothetical protein